MSKLNLTVNLDNLTEKEREKFFKLVEKSKEKSFNPFERVSEGEKYYWNGYSGVANWSYEYHYGVDDDCFDCHNYYNNKEFAEHQALRELLNRKLMKFSYENGGADITKSIDAFSIYVNDYDIYVNDMCPDTLTPWFISEEVAQRAIDEVVKPFLEEHPNFKWWG